MSNGTIGLALGSGAARGWAHIGVLDALEEHGIRPRVVVGASIGSLVGAAYASDQLPTLDDWVRRLRRVDVVRLLDASIGRGGMMSGDRLMRTIREQLDDHLIEELPFPFAAVATQLDTGLEVWLQEGSMLDAVRASSGLPGVFTPVSRDGRWLIDGGVVNSVPISVCRALGADYVIGVNLNRHLRTYPRLRAPEAAPADNDDVSQDEEPKEGWSPQQQWAAIVSGLVESFKADDRDVPGLFEVIGTSISIMQDRIMRSRMVGDPPDVVIDPELGELALFDFHRAEEAIAAGRDAVESVAPELERLKAVAGG